MDPTPADTWVVKANTGEFAPYNDHAGWVDDPLNGAVYMLGGTHPESDAYTSELYRLDTKAMKWQNLTVSFIDEQPFDF